jgi:NAD(P)H-nitrite reductase large subunit
MNSMPLFETPILSAGISEERAGIEVVRHFNEKTDSYKKFYFRNNELVGILLINDIDRAGIYTNLLRNKTDVTEFRDDIGKPDFGLLYMPENVRKDKIISGGSV